MQPWQSTRNPNYTEGRGREQQPPDSDQAEQPREEVAGEESGEKQETRRTDAAEQEGGEGGVEAEDKQQYEACTLPAPSASPGASLQAESHEAAGTDSQARAGGGKGLVFQYPQSFQPPDAQDHCYAAPSPRAAGGARAGLWRDDAQEREPKPPRRYEPVFTDSPDFHRLAAYATPFPKTHPSERKKLQARRHCSPAFQQWRAPVTTEEDGVEEELVQVDDDAIVLSPEDTQARKRPYVIPWSQELEDRVHQEADGPEHEEMDAQVTESLTRMELDVSESEESEYRE